MNQTNQTLNQQATDPTANSKPVTQTNSSKKKYQNFWRGFFILILGLATYLFRKVYIFQTHPHFQPIRQGNITQMLIYGLPFALVYTIIDLIIHKVFDQLCQKYYITEERYKDEQAKKKRSYTLVKWGYSCFYYLFSSIWAYKILIDTNYMPTWLGGKGSPYTMAQTMPRIPDVTLQMKIFYIMQFGKHFSRFFAHLFIRPEGNFFEYCLHHALSTFLIIFSYLTNQWLVGIFVLLIHDYSDFGLTMGRGYKDYKHCKKFILDTLFIHGFIAWCVCRIVLFMIVCIIPSAISITQVNHLSQFQLSVIQFPNVFMVFMMASLQVMHLFWTYFIVQTFVAVKISTKLAKHSYD